MEQQTPQQYDGPERRQSQAPYNGPERRRLDWPFQSGPRVPQSKEDQGH